MMTETKGRSEERPFDRNQRSLAHDLAAQKTSNTQQRSSKKEDRRRFWSIHLIQSRISHAYDVLRGLDSSQIHKAGSQRGYLRRRESITPTCGAEIAGREFNALTNKDASEINVCAGRATYDRISKGSADGDSRVARQNVERTYGVGWKRARIIERTAAVKLSDGLNVVRACERNNAHAKHQEKKNCTVSKFQG